MAIASQNSALENWLQAILTGEPSPAPEIAEAEPFPMRVPMAEEPPAPLKIPAGWQPGRQMITGDINRIFEPGTTTRNYEIPAPRQQFLPREATLPPIFEALKPLMSAATKITGYDPTNPPQVHTLSQPQVMALNPIMFEQYKAATIQRKQKIDAARAQYERLLDIGQTATANKFLQDNQARLKTDNEAAATAVADLNAETEKYRPIFNEYQAVQKRDEVFQKDLTDAKARGVVTQKTDGTVIPNLASPKVVFQEGPDKGKPIPGYVERAKKFNEEAISITKELERLQPLLKKAESDVGKAQTVARGRKQSGQATIPNGTVTSHKIAVISPQGVPGTIPAINLPKALQRGYKLAR